MEIAKARPFLRWAGGKTRLLPELRLRAPAKYGTYFEPFLGGGSLFFDLAPERAVLSDVNPELVNAYLTVRNNVEALIVQLGTLSHGYKQRGCAHYLDVRALSLGSLDEVSRAARLIYLNKTCFNGLYRVNKKDQFNTPPGKFASPPTICDADNLRSCSVALSKATLHVCDYASATVRMSRGDFVYFDPPYVPVSKTANFTSYAKEGFGPAEQKKLAEMAEKLKYRGVLVLLSNSGTDEVAKLYENFEVEEVKMRRNINCSAGKRGLVKEYLIR